MIFCESQLLTLDCWAFDSGLPRNSLFCTSFTLTKGVQLNISIVYLTFLIFEAIDKNLKISIKISKYLELLQSKRFIANNYFLAAT